jgi:hypothetical protein
MRVRFQLLTHVVCHQPVCMAFEPDNTMLDLDTDESSASAGGHSTRGSSQTVTAVTAVTHSHTVQQAESPLGDASSKNLALRLALVLCCAAAAAGSCCC